MICCCCCCCFFFLETNFLKDNRTEERRILEKNTLKLLLSLKKLKNIVCLIVSPPPYITNVKLSKNNRLIGLNSITLITGCHVYTRPLINECSSIGLSICHSFLRSILLTLSYNTDLNFYRPLFFCASTTADKRSALFAREKAECEREWKIYLILKVLC